MKRKQAKKHMIEVMRRPGIHNSGLDERVERSVVGRFRTAKVSKNDPRDARHRCQFATIFRG